MNMRVKDRIAVVTGSGAGIGQACALMFTEQGATACAININSHAVDKTAMEGAPHGIRADTIRPGQQHLQ